MESQGFNCSMHPATFYWICTSPEAQPDMCRPTQIKPTYFCSRRIRLTAAAVQEFWIITFEDSDSISIAINDAAGDFTITTGGHRGSTYADGGQINMSTGGPAAFAIYDNDGGGGSDIAVNNLSETAVAVPEPVSGALVGLGLVALGRRRRR